MPYYSYYCQIMIMVVVTRSVMAGGVFEIRLTDYTNPSNVDADGHCCRNPATTTTSTQQQRQQQQQQQCSSTCTPTFRICLKQYQRIVDPRPPCIYGSRLLQSLHGNDTDVGFPFEHSWPGGFSLIIEVWHNSVATSKPAGSEQLLLRLAETRQVRMGDSWTREEIVGSNGVSLKVTYRVVCEKNYYGNDCSKYCVEGLGNHNYVCAADGEKHCKLGWTGARCDQAVCAPGCQHGSCSVPGTCVCEEGWMGEKCDACLKYPGCEHGTCDDKPFECNCQEGWGGLFCNQDLNYCTHHQPCKNGATCTNTGEGLYTCACEPGYTGTNCEIQIESCALQPCLNDGHCSMTSNGYMCRCREGFSGRHCEISDITCDQSPCLNGATCVSTGQGFKCLCTASYTGSLCDERKDPCEDNPCDNGGRCMHKRNGFHCECPPLFGGRTCSETLDFCSEHLPCYNGGTCEADQVSQFICRCPPGYYGKLCQTPFNECEKRPCANGATCVSGISAVTSSQGFQCFCRPGFTGKLCNIEINECASNPCKNGGHCKDMLADFRCECPSCFAGSRCQQRDDDCLIAGNHTLSYINAPEASASLQRTLLLVGLPVIALFAVIIIGLALFVIVLYRKTNRPHQQTDIETRENHLNQLREQSMMPNRYTEYRKPYGQAKSLCVEDALYCTVGTPNNNNNNISHNNNNNNNNNNFNNISDSGNTYSCHQLSSTSSTPQVPLPRSSPPEKPPPGYEYTIRNTAQQQQHQQQQHQQQHQQQQQQQQPKTLTVRLPDRSPGGGIHLLQRETLTSPDSSGSTCSTVVTSPEDSPNNESVMCVVGKRLTLVDQLSDRQIDSQRDRQLDDAPYENE